MWWLWLILGGLIVVAGLVVFVWLANLYDDRTAARRRAVYARRSDAELQMQKVVQATISEMFGPRGVGNDSYG
ncbi:hypothetical protein SAMN05444157_0714 [Frankineae bacterium MT45]|nr:hypothetical protein SAMN05444157_0714 [Frankineae bacterium MT45]